MSKRVRTAMALDAIEEVVEMCCDSAAKNVMESTHLQNDVSLDISDAVMDAAVIFGVDVNDLRREALKMLSNGLNLKLRPLCELRYVRPYETDKGVVGMTARCYRFEMRTA